MLGSDVTMPPAESHGSHDAPPSVEARCQRPLSVPPTMMSRREDAHDAASGLVVATPPTAIHGPVQFPWMLDLCCQTWLSVPRTKRSVSVELGFTEPGADVRMPPADIQPLQPVPFQVCS